MERMEHAFGKIVTGEATLLERIDCHIGSHARSHGHKSYFGYFETTTDLMAKIQQAGPGPFTLVLDDGRTGDIYVTIHPSNSPDKMSADFHVTGELHDKHHHRRLQR